jgi:NADH-quinone oxidoreductase subunit N
LAGLGYTRPVLAWPMTIAMLSLAGFPATAGFVGKFYLIDASVDGGYTWVGVAIVVGSMISLAKLGAGAVLTGGKGSYAASRAGAPSSSVSRPSTSAGASRMIGRVSAAATGRTSGTETASMTRGRSTRASCRR